jgi:hypothetical protein
VSDRKRSWLVVALAVLVGVGVGTAAVAVTGDDGHDQADQAELDDPHGLPPEHYANAKAFLDAWHRFRTGTFMVQLRFERSITGKDSPLISDGILVQRPPRRVIRAFGNESTVSGADARSCELGENASSLCGPEQSTGPYDVQVAEELSILSQYFSGDAPLYRVEAGGSGCFRLFLYRAMPLPPYGDSAQFCFDAATGAMSLFETTTADGTDRTIAQNISTTVTDADFER